MTSHKQSGLSVIELVVAMVISLLVLGGVYAIFQSNSSSYRVQEELSRLQENGRYAIQILTRDIRMAGFYGCATRTVNLLNTLNVNSTNYLWGKFDSPLRGFEAIPPDEWNEPLDATIIDAVKNSDVLCIRRAGNIPYSITAHGNGTDPLLLDGYAGLSRNDVVLASDCSDNAAIFQITNTPGPIGGVGHLVEFPPDEPPGNKSMDLGKDFTGGEITSLATTSYFVRKNTAGIPALYRRVGAGNSEELVEGVENMQILYGEDTNNDGDVDRYHDAAGIGSWDNVLSVRIGLLLMTVNEIHDVEPDPGPYILAGTPVIPPADRRLRRVVETTIGIRNRMQ
ncbi:MAG: PilW family protein [Desulfovibrionales bacterium]